MLKKEKYDDVIVPKPWGWEYLCYRNSELAIWLLSIDKDQKTSMHCHPKKHTGFVVLNGTAELCWLDRCVRLTGLAKINILQRRFHSTRAVSENGLNLIEVECPEDKEDLVRFNDLYGRANDPYEGEESFIQKTDNCFQLAEPAERPEIFKLYGCNLAHFKFTSNEVLGLGDEETCFIITSGIMGSQGSAIQVPGEVSDGATLKLLTSKFSFSEGSSILKVWK